MFFTHKTESVNLAHVARVSVFDDSRQPDGTVTVGFYLDGGPAYCPLDLAPVGGEGGDPAHLDLVDEAQAIDVAVEQVDLGLQPGGHPRRVPPDVAGAEHHHPGGTHAGCPTHQHAPAAVVALEEVGPDLHRHPATRRRPPRAVAAVPGAAGCRRAGPAVSKPTSSRR